MLSGDTLVFKRSGFLSGILAPVIKLIIDRNYDMWGWHFAKVAWYDDDQKDWVLVEATGGGVRTTFLHSYRNTAVRVYRWLDTPPDRQAIKKFYDERDAAAYDSLVYFWTAAYHILAKVRLYIPRLLNDRYSCWELAEEFDAFFGKPWKSTWKPGHPYPLITDFTHTATLHEEISL